MSSLSSNQAVEYLSVGRRLTPDSLNETFLNEVSEELLNRITNKTIAPSKCAHAMCLSSANGYSEVVKMLSSRPRTDFNKAYSFDEPLCRAVRSWIKAKKDGETEKQMRCEKCAKYLVAAGADIHAPEKYLKTKFSPAERLEKDGSTEALALLAELTATTTTTSTTETTTTKSSKAKKETTEEVPAETTTPTTTTTQKKRKRNA